MNQMTKHSPDLLVVTQLSCKLVVVFQIDFLLFLVGFWGADVKDLILGQHTSSNIR